MLYIHPHRVERILICTYHGISTQLNSCVDCQRLYNSLRAGISLFLSNGVAIVNTFKLSPETYNCGNTLTVTCIYWVPLHILFADLDARTDTVTMTRSLTCMHAPQMANDYVIVTILYFLCGIEQLMNNGCKLSMALHSTTISAHGLAYVCNLSLGPRWQLCSSPRYRDTLMPLSHCCCWSGRTGNFHPGQNTHQLHRLWGGDHMKVNTTQKADVYKITKVHNVFT